MKYTCAKVQLLDVIAVGVLWLPVAGIYASEITRNAFFPLSWSRWWWWWWRWWWWWCVCTRPLVKWIQSDLRLDQTSTHQLATRSSHPHHDHEGDDDDDDGDGGDDYDDDDHGDADDDVDVDDYDYDEDDDDDDDDGGA